MENLRVEFEGHEGVGKFYSQAAQDLFVLAALDGKTGGYYLDIGCYDPVDISNSYLLETEFGWMGMMIDDNAAAVRNCRAVRRGAVYQHDAVTFDYAAEMERNGFPGVIDYISLDIDGMNTLRTLKALPLDRYRFRVMTFEHDAYCRESEVREESRRFLEGLGYVRVCSDVANAGCIYEDWWIDPRLVDAERLAPLVSDGTEWREIIFAK